MNKTKMLQDRVAQSLICLEDKVRGSIRVGGVPWSVSGVREARKAAGNHLKNGLKVLEELVDMINQERGGE